MGRRLLATAVVACALAACTTSPAEDAVEPGASAPATASPAASDPARGHRTATPSAGGTPGPSPSAAPTLLAEPVFDEFPLPAGSRPHDVAPATDGPAAWYVAQGAGQLGRLDPTTGEVRTVPLGEGSAPHGVIVGPGGHPWITDGGRNAIIRVDAEDLTVTEFPLPGPYANLNTAAFDGDGRLWFTGQEGVYGSVDPPSGDVTVHEAPRGRGPYGMTATADGTVWFASLAGSYIARVDAADGTISTWDVPTDGGGARRIWPDSTGRLWVTEWYAGRLARFDPAAEAWDEWDLPGDDPRPYAVWVDERDVVWVTDFAADALVRFEPSTEQFDRFPFPTPGAEVRQLLGRPGEVWGVGSAIDTAIRLRTAE